MVELITSWFWQTLPAFISGLAPVQTCHMLSAWNTSRSRLKYFAALHAAALDGSSTVPSRAFHERRVCQRAAAAASDDGLQSMDEAVAWDDLGGVFRPRQKEPFEMWIEQTHFPHPVWIKDQNAPKSTLSYFFSPSHPANSSQMCRHLFRSS